MAGGGLGLLGEEEERLRALGQATQAPHEV